MNRIRLGACRPPWGRPRSRNMGFVRTICVRPVESGVSIQYCIHCPMVLDGQTCAMLCSRRGKINGPVRKTHSSVLLVNSPEEHQITPFANCGNRSHLAVRKTHHMFHKRGKINGPVRKTHSSVLVANNPVQHQITPFAVFGNRSQFLETVRILPFAKHIMTGQVGRVGRRQGTLDLLGETGWDGAVPPRGVAPS